MFQYDEQVWTKGGQQLQEFWNSAEQHLKASMAKLTVHMTEQPVCSTSLLSRMMGKLCNVLKVPAEAVLWCIHT